MGLARRKYDPDDPTRFQRWCACVANTIKLPVAIVVSEPEVVNVSDHDGVQYLAERVYAIGAIVQ